MSLAASSALTAASVRRSIATGFGKRRVELGRRVRHHLKQSDGAHRRARCAIEMRLLPREAEHQQRIDVVASRRGRDLGPIGARIRERPEIIRAGRSRGAEDTGRSTTTSASRPMCDRRPPQTRGPRAARRRHRGERRCSAGARRPRPPTAIRLSRGARPPDSRDAPSPHRDRVRAGNASDGAGSDAPIRSAARMP